VGERGPSIQPARRVQAARRGAAQANARDFQGLLARAVSRLAEETGATRAVAWGRDPAGTPAVLAARLEGSALLAPDEAAFTRMAGLAGPLDLGDADVPAAIAELAIEHGFAAAAPVTTAEAEAPAILMIGGAEAPGQVRPRTLAALAAAAERLSAPAGAAATAERLGRLDLEVQRLDRLAALGGLVAEIVHEVRNPLVTVKTFMQLLPEHEGDEEFHGEFLTVALEEVRRIERLLDIVLENARPRAAHGASGTDVAAAFESLARLLAYRASDRGVALCAEAPDALARPRIHGDALRQVLLNLALNGLDVTPEGGRVALSARSTDDGIEIDVRDAGPGVPEALRDRLFEPFFSTKSERPGGLGLGISRRLVEEAGGRIEILDAEGGGSIFRISLPRASEPAT